MRDRGPTSKGPWDYQERPAGASGHFQYWITAEGYRRIADVHQQQGQTENNARLIAAAPELLKACKIALDALGCDRIREDRLVAQRIIHKAVKQAEGREG